MKEPKFVPGSPPLLFDRLLNERSGSRVKPERILSRNDVRESVRKELARLLNTRRPSTGPLASPLEQSVITYGIPNFSSLSPSSDSDRKQIAADIAQAIASHEPRLMNVRVTMVPDPANRMRLLCRLDGNLKIGSVVEPVTFPFIYGTAGQTEILDPV